MTGLQPKRMPSPEGRGNAQRAFRKAWDGYVRAVGKPLTPAVNRFAGWLAPQMTDDLMGFWLAWQLEGGYEGFERRGVSRSAIYRRIGMFRRVVGVHPDEFSIPGVTIDVETYLRESPTWLEEIRAKYGDSAVVDGVALDKDEE